jgi:hypothetical protein
MNNNRLVNNYMTSKQNNHFNNIFLKNNVTHLNNPQTQAHIMNTKNLHNMHKIEQLNNLENKYDVNKIKDAIISPTKVTITPAERKKQNDIVNQLNSEYDVKDKKHLSMLNNHWNLRTNDPYKNIIKDEKFYSKFLKENLIRNKIMSDNDKKKMINDLIVHKVTNADKYGVDKQFDQFKEGLEKHNSELKVIYSTSKEATHKKQFDYNHKDRFRIKYNPSDHKQLKDNKIIMYKKAQQELEKDKLTKDTIIEDLINTGIIDNTLDTNVNKLTNNLNNNIPTKIYNNTPVKSTNNMPVKLTNNMPVKLTNNMPGKLTNNMPVKVTNNTSANINNSSNNNKIRYKVNSNIRK